jgi:isoleucyl-tRNA synthetase
VRRAIADYDFHALFTALHNFCAVDLSAFYVDIRKDRLYCDGADDPLRRATRTVMDRVFDCLVRWLAPILCFTAEEAWLARHGVADGRSVHLELFAEVPEAWHDPAVAARWDRLRDIRRVATGALERERAAKRIGSSLQAAVEVYVDDPADLGDVDLAELCITSAAALCVRDAPEGAFGLPDVPGVAVMVREAPGGKCQRCWRVLPEIGHVPGHDDLCGRCAGVLDRGAGAAAAA